MDTENRNSYKQSLKATSLFGGVQIFNILIQIIRSKFAAVLLGPEGMGVMGLLNSTITMISSFTNCGLGPVPYVILQKLTEPMILNV